MRLDRIGSNLTFFSSGCLDATDAQFVEVVHTNGGLTPPTQTGISPRYVLVANWFMYNVIVKVYCTMFFIINDYRLTANQMEFNLGLGLLQLSGHLDFYPNGGEWQCSELEWPKGPITFAACSHQRAIKMFHTSISPIEMNHGCRVTKPSASSSLMNTTIMRRLKTR